MTYETVLVPDTDIYMDEQSSRKVTVNVVYPDGTPRDITGGAVNWVASFNGVQQIKKDTPTMTVMLSPTPSTAFSADVSGDQKNVAVVKVKGFGYDDWGRAIPDFAPGDIVNIADNASHAETNTVATIDTGTNTLTMVNDLVNSYATGDSPTVTKIISSFVFYLLPGDTSLPATKSYGTKIIWNHMAQVTFPAPLSPGNIYQANTTVVAVRGRIFIDPILDMS